MQRWPVGVLAVRLRSYYPCEPPNVNALAGELTRNDDATNNDGLRGLAGAPSLQRRNRLHSGTDRARERCRILELRDELGERPNVGKEPAGVVGDLLRAL